MPGKWAIPPTGHLCSQLACGCYVFPVVRTVIRRFTLFVVLVPLPVLLRDSLFALRLVGAITCLAPALISALPTAVLSEVIHCLYLLTSGAESPIHSVPFL